MQYEPWAIMVSVYSAVSRGPLGTQEVTRYLFVSRGVCKATSCFNLQGEQLVTTFYNSCADDTIYVLELTISPSMRL